MRVVILGATRRLGRHVVEACIASGHEVVAVSRRDRSPQSGGAQEWATWPAQDSAGYRRLFAGVDTVIDARNQRYDDWSRYPAMIEATLIALRGTRAHYVYVDNVYLYGNPNDSTALDETAPRRPVSVKGTIRRAIEQRVVTAMSTHPITIARFPTFTPFPRTRCREPCDGSGHPHWRINSFTSPTPPTPCACWPRMRRRPPALSFISRAPSR